MKGIAVGILIGFFISQQWVNWDVGHRLRDLEARPEVCQ